jgi:DNA-binding MarR family transcriptional regulator
VTFSDTERKVLLALHKLGRATRLQTQREADGTTLSSVSRISLAMKSLEDAGFVERAYDARYGTGSRTYRLTDAGRLHVEAASAFDTDPKGAA